jgi:membrane protein
MQQKPTLIEFFKGVYNIWITERPSQLAAALAYFSLFSFAPIIYIAFKISSVVLNAALVESQIIEQLAARMNPEVYEYLESSVNQLAETTSGGNIIITLIGIMALFYAASSLFFQIQYALNKIWNVPLPERGQTGVFIRQRLFSFLMVLGVALLLIVVILASLVISFVDNIVDLNLFIRILNTLTLLIIITAALILVYKILPDTNIAWRDVILGAFSAAVMLMIAAFFLGLYISSSRLTSAAEAAGTVAVFLITFNVMAQIFLIGAIISRVYAHTYGSRVVERA